MINARTFALAPSVQPRWLTAHSMTSDTHSRNLSGVILNKLSANAFFRIIYIFGSNICARKRNFGNLQTCDPGLGDNCLVCRPAVKTERVLISLLLKHYDICYTTKSGHNDDKLKLHTLYYLSTKFTL